MFSPVRIKEISCGTHQLELILPKDSKAFSADVWLVRWRSRRSLEVSLLPPDLGGKTARLTAFAPLTGTRRRSGHGRARSPTSVAGATVFVQRWPYVLQRTC